MSGQASATARAIEAAATRDRRLHVAIELAKRALAGRTGHGGGECCSRVLNREQLAAFAVLAMEQWDVLEGREAPTPAQP